MLNLGTVGVDVVSAMSERPKCYNRPAFPDHEVVQNGWFDIPVFPGVSYRVPYMVRIPNPMSKGCQQHEPFGEARRNGWNCDGCKWKP